MGNNSTEVGILDYGVSNLRSVCNALAFLGHTARIINKPQDIRHCDRLILPGVGAFGPAMSKLEKLGFADALREQVIHKERPLLGICLGMQLLLSESHEGGVFPGLQFIAGDVRPLREIAGTRPVPHVGWNDAIPTGKGVLFAEVSPDDCSFYFVHSFYCRPKNENIVAATAQYGENFAVALEHENLLACQFHPEKSQKNGLAIFKQFLTL